MNKVIVFLIVTLLNSAAFSKPLIWTAARVNGKTITSYDVLKFTMALELSDGAMIRLFKKADGDFSKYEEEVAKWAEPKFEKNLKTMVYTKILKHKAITEFGNDKFFNVTTREYLEQVDKLERSVLGHLLDQRKGIVKSREIYGQFLIDSQYPHRDGESATDVYFNWFKLSKARIKIENLLKETKEFQTAMAFNSRSNRYKGKIEGLAIWDFYDKAKKSLKNINGKRVSVKELKDLLDKNYEVKVLTDSYSHRSLLNTPLLELANEGNIAQISEFDSIISSKQFKSKVDKYRNKASQLANTKEDLEAKKDLAVRDFIKTKSDKYLMLAHIYELALSNNKSNQSVDKIIEQARTTISNSMSSPSKNDNFIQVAERSLLSVADNDDKLKQMIHFMITFEAKKIALADKGIVEIKLIDYKASKSYDIIKNGIIEQRYNVGMKEFREELRSSIPWSLRVNVSGTHNLSDHELPNFLYGSN